MNVTDLKKTKLMFESISIKKKNKLKDVLEPAVVYVHDQGDHTEYSLLRNF